MQLRLWIAASVFLGSYFPLSVILLVQDYETKFLSQNICLDFFSPDSSCVLPLKNPITSLLFVTACLTGLLLTSSVFLTARSKRQVEVRTSKHIPSEMINYTLPYIVSFMGLNYNEPNKVLGFFIFLSWMFWITYKSGLIVLNPVLIVMGWRLYEITCREIGKKAEYQAVVLSRAEIFSGKIYKYAPIQDIYIIKGASELRLSDGVA